jgi:hypothetical protein
MRLLLLIGAASLAGCFNPALPVQSFHCRPDSSPQCPGGATCVRTGSDAEGALGQCIRQGGDGGVGGAISITKTGPAYTGPMVDPGLDTVADCPDNALEPNDSINSSKLFKADVGTPDMVSPKITNVAICPKGNRPETGAHDIDVYIADLTNFPGQLTLMAQLFYQIQYGDLDVGIFREDGSVLASDGSATDNGCAAATVAGGSKYYIAVAGANNMDVAPYDLRVRLFSSPQTCAANVPADMAGVD